MLMKIAPKYLQISANDSVITKPPGHSTSHLSPHLGQSMESNITNISHIAGGTTKRLDEMVIENNI